MIIFAMVCQMFLRCERQVAVAADKPVVAIRSAGKHYGERVFGFARHPHFSLVEHINRGSQPLAGCLPAMEMDIIKSIPAVGWYSAKSDVLSYNVLKIPNQGIQYFSIIII